MSENLLLTPPKYKTTVTTFGPRREFLYSSGARFSDYASHATFMGAPLVTIANGRNPETGKRLSPGGFSRSASELAGWWPSGS